MQKGWTHNIFGCFRNPIMCCCATFIPFGCCYMHTINAKVSRDNNSAGLALCCVLFLLPIGACFNRFRIREKYDIRPASSCACDSFNAEECCCGMTTDIGCDTACECCQYCTCWDCCVSLICPCCAVVQEWREVMEREKNSSDIKFWDL